MRAKETVTFLQKRLRNFELSVTPLLYFARDKKTIDLSTTSEKFPEEGLAETFLKNMQV